MMRIEHGDYASVLPPFKADLICTSPPYNIGSRSPRRDGFRKLGKYDPKSFRGVTDYADTLPENEYQDSQAAFLHWCAEHLAVNGTLVYNHKPRRRGHALLHPVVWISRVPELTLVEEVIWNRGSTHNHSRAMLWPQTERLYVLRRRSGFYRFDNTRHLPQRSDVWNIPLRSQGARHNAAFPLELAQAILAAWSQPGDLVCDPYSGSGTTALAAKGMRRRFIGAERLKKYHTLALERIAA